MPGGFAERVLVTEGVRAAGLASTTRTGRWSSRSRACCAALARVPRGRVLVVGQGFIGRLFAAVLERRGDDVFAVDPTRAGRGRATGRAGGGGSRLRSRRRGDGARVRSSPAARSLVFADAGPLPAEVVYRRELTIVGTRSATPESMREAVALLPELELPEPVVLPLERFAEGLELFLRRRGAEGRVRPVRALRWYAPGDVRVDEVPDPEPGPGDVLVRVEVALTDGTDLKAFRRGHPLLLGEPPSPFGHEFCGVDVATGRRVVAANSAPCGACAACARGEEALCERLLPLLNGAYAELLVVPERIARVNLLPVPAGLASEVAALVEPLACCLHGVERAGVEAGDTVAVLGAGPIGLMLCACVADAGARPVVVGGRPERRALAAEFGAVPGDGAGCRRRDRGDGQRGRLARRGRARPSRRHRRALQRPARGDGGAVRRVSPPLRAGDRARRLPPHAADGARRARVPRERRAPVGAADHARGRARRRCRAVRRPAARLPEGRRPRLVREERQVGLALAAQEREVDLGAADAA